MIKYEIKKIIKSGQYIPVLIGIIVSFCFAAMYVEEFSEIMPTIDVKSYIWLSFEVGGSFFLPIIMAYIFSIVYAQEYQYNTTKVLWKSVHSRGKIFCYKFVAIVLTMSLLYLISASIYCMLVFALVNEFDPFLGSEMLTKTEYIGRIIVVFAVRNIQIIAVGAFSVLLTVITKNKLIPVIVVLFLFLTWGYIPASETMREFMDKYVLFFNNDYVYGLTSFGNDWELNLATAFVLYILESVVFYAFAKKIFSKQEL